MEYEAKAFLRSYKANMAMELVSRETPPHLRWVIDKVRDRSKVATFLVLHAYEATGARGTTVKDLTKELTRMGFDVGVSPSKVGDLITVDWGNPPQIDKVVDRQDGGV